MPTDSRRDRSREQSWSKEDSWRALFPARQTESVRSPDDVEPAYRYGCEYAVRYVGRHWDEVEPELRRRWDRWAHRGDSTWNEVKETVREAYQHAAEDAPADSGHP